MSDRIPTVKLAAEDRHLVYGEVYAPDRPDAQGEFMRASEIEKMAHEFARKNQMGQIDVMHDNEVVNGASVVESFIARKGDPDFIEGAWVVGVHVPDEKLWQRIKKGDINGFSMEALVSRHPQQVEVEMPPVVRGLTSKTEDHTHDFYVSYDREGNFKGGTTSMVEGHKHDIIAGTHTETVRGHSHRFSSVDDLRIL
jgi:hypothetical protein